MNAAVALKDDDNCTNFQNNLNEGYVVRRTNDVGWLEVKIGLGRSRSILVCSTAVPVLSS